MLRPRISPCLLLRDGGLVKTVRFGQAKYVGDPINAVRIFNEKEADELIVLDIDATAQGRDPDYRLIGHLAAECRMPLCYGGGVRTLEQAKRIIGLGVEKVSLSTAAIEVPGLVEAIARTAGSQSTVVTLDVQGNSAAKDGYELWAGVPRRMQPRSPLEFAKQMESAGAGEIVVNSIDRDGEMKGYDLDLARLARDAVSIPLTFLGGAGSRLDIEALFRTCGVVGAAAGSLFVFKGKFRAVLINYPSATEKDDMIRSALAGKNAVSRLENV